jgi:hypothetical protein
MGLKWFVVLTVLVLVQGVSAEGKKKKKDKAPAPAASSAREAPLDFSGHEDARAILKRCGIPTGDQDETKQEPKQEAQASDPDNLTQRPLVLMMDEINRRLMDKFGGLHGSRLGSGEFIQQYFSLKILKDSDMLQVDQDDQALMFKDLMLGRDDGQTGWQVIEKRPEDVKIDEGGRFSSGVATMLNAKNQTYQVACVTLGNAQRSFAHATSDRSDNSFLCRLLREKMADEHTSKFPGRFFRGKEDLYNEDFFEGKGKRRMWSDVYACFISQSGT